MGGRPAHDELIPEREDQQHGGGSDRDTHINPDSSPKLPADLGADADRAAQAVFEEQAVAEGSYCADPDFEWEPGVAEVDH